MANLLKRGERWLADKQTKLTSETVTYVVSVASVGVSATIGRSTFDVEDVNGLQISVETIDFIIPFDELVIDGLAYEPQPGNRVEWDGRRYEVSSPGPGLPHWKWDGEFRSRYRIHTKFVGETP